MYDKNGNYDYGSAAEEAMFRPRLAQRLSRGGQRIWGCVVLIVVLALIGALSYGSWYLVGRAVGAGIDDARR